MKYKKIELDGFTYIYVNEHILNTKTSAICLSEIIDNLNHGIKKGEKHYIEPFVNDVRECYGCRRIIASNDPKVKNVLSLEEFNGNIDDSNLNCSYELMIEQLSH